MPDPRCETVSVRALPGVFRAVSVHAHVLWRCNLDASNITLLIPNVSQCSIPAGRYRFDASKLIPKDRRSSLLDGFLVPGIEESQGKGPGCTRPRNARTDSILLGLAVRALPVCR